MTNYAILEIEVRGRERERFLNLCVYHGITLKNIRWEEEKIICNIDAGQFFSLKPIVHKTGTVIKIRKKRGYYFSCKNFLKKKIYLLFLVMSLMFLLLVSRFLWKIEIRGNLKVSSHLIYEFLKEEGVTYGMNLSKIRGEELEQELRKEFQEITWISVSVEGTTLKIDMKENDAPGEYPNTLRQRDIIADKQGIVEAILIREGTSAVKIGDMVEKGDVLIKGVCLVHKEDKGEIIEVPVAARGDVTIGYRIPIDEKVLLEYESKIYSGKEISKYQLYTRKKVYDLNDDRVPFFMYDYYEEEITPYLLRMLDLDFKVIKRNYRDYLLHREKYSYKEAEEILWNNFHKIIKTLEEKGVQIIEKNVKIKTDHFSVSLEGELRVREVFKEKDYRNE